MAESTSSAVLTRLRANWRTAGIAATDDDLDAMLRHSFLHTAERLDALAAQYALDTPPDYLMPFSPPATPPPTSHAPTPRPGTIRALAHDIAQRVVSPVELVTQALDRIAARNAKLNAFQLVLHDEALAAARQAEQELMAGNHRGPLHGVPVAVKDLLAMQGTITTAGSRILADNLTTHDADGVAALRAAGAIIVGKTRMSEFAFAPGSVNPHYGPTGNPHDPQRDAGGSSSGSAASVADGMVYAALGSDTGGSIRIPAALCGIVGLKPTFGRLSLRGAVPLAWSLDHLGPLTRSVDDAALLLDVLAGARVASHALSDEADLRGLRIGVLRADGRDEPLAAPAILAAWNGGLARLAQAGATLVELDLPQFDALRHLNIAIMAQEAQAYHQPNIRTRLADYGSFIRPRLLATYAYDQGTFIRAQQLRALLRHEVSAIWQQVDLLTTPTLPAGAPPRGTPSATIFTGPFNLLGWPAISLPSGTDADGLPVGLQLVAPAWQEATLLRAAQAFEATV
jgi:Asp-tRNA(Asn)/Glu-tRNA(Gln) amidotransferase A subunit family amidase